MAQANVATWPFRIQVLGPELEGSCGDSDALPAIYHRCTDLGNVRRSRDVADPSHFVSEFLDTELSLRGLEDMVKHLWFAGSKGPAAQLHVQVGVMGRELIVADRMDLHLLHDHQGRIFLKPCPRFLLDSHFWQRYLKCPDGCACEKTGMPLSGISECKRAVQGVALGFLYTYACLIASETDFRIANENHLLPRLTNGSTIEWSKWKTLARELLKRHLDDPSRIHPRFLRVELRLSRINIINRFTRLPPFNPYLRSWHNYSSLFRDNLNWMAAAAIFQALILTAMQVGLATERLQNDMRFQQASYGFTVFSTLGPVMFFGLVILGALFNLVKDVPWLLRNNRARDGYPRIQV